VHFWSLSEKYLEPFDGIIPSRTAALGRTRNIFIYDSSLQLFHATFDPNDCRPHCLLLHSFPSGSFAMFPDVSHVDVEKSGKPLGDVQPARFVIFIKQIGRSPSDVSAHMSIPQG
jgi:hypothetical protein